LLRSNSLLTPDQAALQITEFLMPFIGMLVMIIIAMMIKDWAMKVAKGMAFAFNKSFSEGDKVILDGERALIVKIGMTQTVFGINKKGGEWDGDYVWRYVPNERIDTLKLEKVIFDRKPIINESDIAKNRELIRKNMESIEEIKNVG